MKKIHKGTLWSGYRAVITSILAKQIFPHLFRHRDRFYKRYINTTDKKKYLDDDGSGVKPKHFLQRRTRCISFGDPIYELWDRDRKIAGDNFGKKRKPTGFIFFPGSDFREAEGHLSMSLCLQDAVINSSPRIGKYIDKQELYRQCLPRKVKDRNISEIENTSCVRNVMKVTPVSGIER